MPSAASRLCESCSTAPSSATAPIVFEHFGAPPTSDTCPTPKCAELMDTGSHVLFVCKEGPAPHAHLLNISTGDWGSEIVAFPPAVENKFDYKFRTTGKFTISALIEDEESERCSLVLFQLADLFGPCPRFIKKWELDLTEYWKTKGECIETRLVSLGEEQLDVVFLHANSVDACSVIVSDGKIYAADEHDEVINFSCVLYTFPRNGRIRMAYLKTTPNIDVEPEDQPNPVPNRANDGQIKNNKDKKSQGKNTITVDVPPLMPTDPADLEYSFSGFGDCVFVFNDDNRLYHYHHSKRLKKYIELPTIFEKMPEDITHTMISAKGAMTICSSTRCRCPENHPGVGIQRAWIGPKPLSVAAMEVVESRILPHSTNRKRSINAHERIVEAFKALESAKRIRIESSDE